MEELHVCETPVGELALEQIEKAASAKLGRERYELWLEGKTRFSLTVSDSDTTLRISAANPFAANWIRSKFSDDLRAAAESVLHRPVHLSVDVDASVHASSSADDTAAAPTAPAFSGSATQSASPAAGAKLTTFINPRHTFEEFVVGACNQLAYHAAHRVAENPGQQFSPLFIHGLCGMGKTHLLQAICHKFSRLHPGKKWLYLTGEGFTNEFLDALRHHKTEAFRRRVRGADLLIIDDVHFLASKKATQEEFLHTFNQIDGGTGRQIVLASDCAPRAIAAMAEPLISRFVSGMVVRMDPPELATRLEIVRRKASRNRWPLSEAVLMHVAQSSTGSVRELEGTLLQVVAGMTLIANGTANPAEIAASIKDRAMPTQGPVAVTKIIDTVAAHFGVESAAMLGSTRDKSVALARAVAMHLSRKLTGMSFPEIGRAMGNKNHSTVIAACQRVDLLLASSDLLCWKHNTDGPRHQAISDILHETEGALRRTR